MPYPWGEPQGDAAEAFALAADMWAHAHSETPLRPCRWTAQRMIDVVDWSDEARAARAEIYEGDGA